MLTTGVFGTACSSDFDTTRPARPKTTLGEDIFSTICDRVGATSLAEDLSGKSYHGICHKGADGWTATKVEASVLYATPKGSPAEARRKLGVAKLEVLAEHRAELIEAFDTALPDKQIDDPFEPGKTVRLHDAMTVFLQRLTPLYESSPVAGDTGALVPSGTEAIARFFGAIASSPDAQRAFSKISSREGYRPVSVALGNLRPFFAYPRLRSLTKLAVDRLGPGGALEAPFQTLLRVVEAEMLALKPDPVEPAITIDAAKAQPNRPRQKLEVLATLMLAEDPAYTKGSSSRFIARRDPRGFVLPAGAGTGSLPSPFVADKDGYAKVNDAGQFVDASGAPILLAPPFQGPSIAIPTGVTFDTSGRPLRSGSLVYSYLDTSKSFIGSLLFDLQPLVATPPKGQSTLMKTLASLYILYGDRDGDVFQADTSPFLDVTWAMGQLLGAPESDDWLSSVMTLHEQHPDRTADAAALGYRIKQEAKDAKYADAVLSDDATFWDEMADWIAKVARVDKGYYSGPAGGKPQGLLGDLTLALAHPAAVEWLPQAYAPAMRSNDRITYDSNNLNGPPVNLDKGGAPMAKGEVLSHPVDRTKPDTGMNRSALQRFLTVIAASSGVKTCNKPAAKVVSALDICGLKIDLSYPIGGGTIDECDLFQIDDIGVFFVDSVLDWNHPRRAKLKVKDATLTGLLNAVDKLTFGACNLDIDTVLEKSSGIQGLTTTPTPEALTRLIFFGADSTLFGNTVFDIDKQIPGVPGSVGSKNSVINRFVSNSVNPTATNKCPKTKENGVNVCQKFDETLRGAAYATFFASETPWLPKHPDGCVGKDCALPSSGFFEGMRPMLTAFANYGYDPDPGEACYKHPGQSRCAGENLFSQLMTILDKHWQGTSASKLVKYEDLMAYVFSDSGLFKTAAALAPILRDEGITSARVTPGKPRSHLEITTELLRYFFDQKVAKAHGITDRQGSATTTWNDQKTQKQVTPYDLFAQAMRRMDGRFANQPDALPVWREARSELIDQLLFAEGTTWKNPAVAKALLDIGRVTREQLNANCPDRESTGQCAWARQEMTDKLRAVVGGPLFGAIHELQERLRRDPELRGELEALLQYLLKEAQDPDAMATLISSMADLLQILHDDQDIAPIFNAVSIAAKSGYQKDGKTRVDDPGVGHETVKLIEVLMDDSGGKDKTYDRYHALDHLLRGLVTPPATGKRTPLEVLIDVIADVNRIDSSIEGGLGADDYKTIAESIQGFLVDDYRGLNQLYTIVRGRNGD